MKGSLAALQDESGDRDAVHHVRGGGAVVVVVGAGEAAIERGDLVVKFAQAADATQARGVERAGKQSGLGAQPAVQVPQEILLIQTVAGQMQSVSRGREVDRRTYRRHRAKLTRDLRFPIRPPVSAPGFRPWKIRPGQSGRCGPARSGFAPRQRRPASGRNGRAWAPEPSVPPQLRWFIRTTFMPERQALGGNPQHVAGIARAFEAVDDDDRQRVLPLALPVAMGQNLDARLDFDQARLGRWQSDAAREEEAGQGLPVSAAQAAPRQESRRFRLHSLHCLILNGYDKW